MRVYVAEQADKQKNLGNADVLTGKISVHR